MSVRLGQTADAMAGSDRFTVIRDPVWNNIQVERKALDVLDSEPFQRLRYVRQLGHAYLVYPGATHTRFEHALGTYHLAHRALTILAERGDLDGIDVEERTVVRFAALLHDIGHYPFSHSLEEAGLPSHEELAAEHFRHAGLNAVFQSTLIENLPTRLVELIGGVSESPLAGLISGSLDLDKIEYLTRDARMCGVPYGVVDVDRLLHSLTIVALPDGSRAVGIHGKGVSALESLLFARYQMYRNVYWHHAVRSATAMFKRAVRNAIRNESLDGAWIAGSTDEALIERLLKLPNAYIAQRLRGRDLYKRVVEVSGGEIPQGAGNWIASDPDLVEAVEDRIAAEIGLTPGAVLLDYPTKSQLIDVDIPLLTDDGTVEWLRGGAEQGLAIRQVGETLHASARSLRVFAVSEVRISTSAVLTLAAQTGAEVRDTLAGGAALTQC